MIHQIQTRSLREVLRDRSTCLLITRQWYRSHPNVPARRSNLSGCRSFFRKRNDLRYRFLSSTTNASSNSAVHHMPPFPVRTALVATATAIGTPAFPVVGTLNFAFRYVLWEKNTRYAVLGVTTLVGGMATLFTMAINDWMPFVYSYSQLFLPFAVVNGVLAGTAYAGLDAALGTAYIVRTPWAGAAMGAFVGFMGPVTGLYDAAFQWFYDIPEVDGWISAFLSNGFVLPISVTTGMGVGALMHPLLYFPIMGIRNVHYTKSSLPILIGGTLLMAHLYHGDYFDDEIFPPETYLTTSEKRNMMALSRFHAKRLQAEDWCLGAGYQPLGTGAETREVIREKLKAVQSGKNNRTDMLFDSRRKAWLHYVTKGLVGQDVAIDSVPTESEMNRRALRLIRSDGAVSFTLLQNNAGENPGIASLRKDLVGLVKNLQASSTSNSSTERDIKHAKRTVAQIELASCGIAVLFTELYKNKRETRKRANNQQKDHQERLLEHLEQSIRRIAPGILLYRLDEGEDFEGCSVEAQLEEFGWDGLTDEQMKEKVWLKWKAGCERYEREALTNRLLWAAAGFSLAVLYSFIGSEN